MPTNPLGGSVDRQPHASLWTAGATRSTPAPWRTAEHGRGQDRRWLERARWMLLGSAAIVLLAGLMVYVPAWLYPPISSRTLDRQGVVGKDRLQLQNDRLKLEADTRATLLQGLAGLAVFTGAIVGWRQLHHTVQATHAQQELDRSGQLTERFTRAIEQLGSDKHEIFLGGLYALERIAHESPDDRASIAEVLTAYIRAHAPWPPLSSKPHSSEATTEKMPALRTRAPDIQAVITVLGRGGLAQTTTIDVGLAFGVSLDLGGVDLRRASLSSADLQRAFLTGAQLQNSTLIGAQLQEAWLHYAQLQSADLNSAQLQGAQLSGAKLQGALLFGADLREALLAGAQLQGAYLTRAQLLQANLTNAQLQGVSLGGAQLQGADLTGADLKGAKLTDEYCSSPADFRGAVASRETVWPSPEFDPKAAGVHVVDANQAKRRSRRSGETRPLMWANPS
jgi:uncharacterized protein YjbI with pentapeptide repeats